jgi:hypothetical protein
VICIFKDVDMKRFDITVGDVFEVRAFDLVDIKDVSELARINGLVTRERLRSRLSYWILGSIALALLIATLIGLYHGSFAEVSYVWSASALPLGFVLRSYFEKSAPP